MRMPDGSTGPLDWEWKVANHALFDALELPPYEKDDVAVWATYQGMFMLNQHLQDLRSGVPTMSMESIVKDPNQLQVVVSYLTKNRCKFTPELLDKAYEVVDLPFRGEEKINADPKVLYDQWPEWKRIAFRKLVDPVILEAFQSYGYGFCE